MNLQATCQFRHASVPIGRRSLHVFLALLIIVIVLLIAIRGGGCPYFLFLFLFIFIVIYINRLWLGRNRRSSCRAGIAIVIVAPACDGQMSIDVGALVITDRCNSSPPKNVSKISPRTIVAMQETRVIHARLAQLERIVPSYQQRERAREEKTYPGASWAIGCSWKKGCQKNSRSS